MHPTLLKLRQKSESLKKKTRARNETSDWTKFWLSLQKAQKRLERELSQIHVPDVEEENHQEVEDTQ